MGDDESWVGTYNPPASLLRGPRRPPLGTKGTTLTLTRGLFQHIVELSTNRSREVTPPPPHPCAMLTNIHADSPAPLCFLQPMFVSAWQQGGWLAFAITYFPPSGRQH